MSNGAGEGRAQFNYENGYASLASFIASDVDKSTAIYRRFDRLSARNLLFLQSELEELQDLQDQFDAEDSKGAIEEKAIIRNLAILKQRVKDGDAKAKRRLELLERLQIR